MRIDVVTVDGQNLENGIAEARSGAQETELIIIHMRARKSVAVTLQESS